MKKIYVMFAALVAAVGFSACNETWDDNPKLGTHEGDVVKDFLNVPEMSNMALQITEANNAETVVLTCSQPTEYGYAASVSYQVELSLSEDFTTPAVPSAPASVMLSNSFRDCSNINPTLRSIAESMCKLLDIKDASQVPTDYMPLYVRLHANVVNENGTVVPGTAFTSNTVSFKGISCGYLAIVVPDIPAGFYIRGNMNDWLNPILKDTDPANWTPEMLAELAKYEFVTTSESDVYILEYVEIEKDVEFKIADKGWGIDLGKADNAPAPGEKYELAWKGGNITLASNFKGSITLSGSGQNWSILMEALEADVPGKPSGIYLRGVGNDWDGLNLEFLTTDVKGVWEIANVTIPTGSFKVADKDWGTTAGIELNLGAHQVDGANAPIVPGEKYALEKGGTNIPIENDFTGKVTLRVQGGNYSLTLERAL